MEEDAVFPKCEHALVHLALVRTLREQHAVGRRLTALIEQGAGPKERKRMAAVLRAFTRMYRPHVAREDTVLFPAYAALLDASARDAIGEKFEEREVALFGRDGFARKVAEVAELEAALDLGDLARVTAYDAK
jgi:hemerythrin-like domain-containing protein